VRTIYLLSLDNEHQEHSTGNGNYIGKKSLQAKSEDEELYPVTQETERFYQHFENALKATGFIGDKHPGLVMTKLRRLFNRARPDVKEIKMMRGILASIERTAKKQP
jgi:tRNA (cytidine32/uridine32-2'-O)-methyltransferase